MAMSRRPSPRVFPWVLRYAKGIGEPESRQKKGLWLPPIFVPRFVAVESVGWPILTVNQ